MIKSIISFIIGILFFLLIQPGFLSFASNHGWNWGTLHKAIIAPLIISLFIFMNVFVIKNKIMQYLIIGFLIAGAVSFPIYYNFDNLFSGRVAEFSKLRFDLIAASKDTIRLEEGKSLFFSKKISIRRKPVCKNQIWCTSLFNYAFKSRTQPNQYVVKDSFDCLANYDYVFATASEWESCYENNQQALLVYDHKLILKDQYVFAKKKPIKSM